MTRIGYEYLGCRFHECPHDCGVQSVQTKEDQTKEKERMRFLRRHLDQVVTIYGCEWKSKKADMWAHGKTIKSSISEFLGRKTIGEHEILKGIENGSFFGIAKVDIQTPQEVINRYRKLNFPLIFRYLEISEDMLPSEILEQARDRQTQFPLNAKTLCWNAEGYVGCTPLLKFYASLGMKISNLQWALEYESGTPFKDFVDELVEERIKALKEKDDTRGDRAKFVLNSAVGKLLLRILYIV